MKGPLIAACIVLLSQVAGANAREYRGEDAGTVVYSLGNVGEELGLMLYYRRVGHSGGIFGDGGTLIYNPGGIFDHPDFSGHESGDVYVAHMKPGDYEFYTYDIYGGAGPTAYILRPKREFSIPFTVTMGKTAYIGDFATVMAKGGLIEPWIVVSDKHERDVPIANTKDPKLQPVTTAVPDVARLGVADFGTTEAH